MAQISVPEARVLLVTPYDKSSLKDVEHALLASDLGLTPANDGTAIRLVIPQLTEERRKEIVKAASAKVEEAKIAIRNVREAARKELKTAELPEDITKKAEKTVDELTKTFTDQIDAAFKTKSAEIMTI